MLTETYTWTADNGNGTFTNPLFYDEFSDPDLIRVGDDYYLTGTSMHTMPGLPILHSKDLVNWTLLSYAEKRLHLGPELRMEDGEDFYGQGIWGPCFRHHRDTFYIFSNVNGYGTQIYCSADPAGPWERRTMNARLHDLTVLFDDDGKIYAVWGYNEVKMVQLTNDLMDVVPGTERVIVPPPAVVRVRAATSIRSMANITSPIPTMSPCATRSASGRTNLTGPTRST